jgi:hypothetical protein
MADENNIRAFLDWAKAQGAEPPDENGPGLALDSHDEWRQANPDEADLIVQFLAMNELLRTIWDPYKIGFTHAFPPS